MIIHPSLLITDDDRDFRETLREIFEPHGFRTWLAGDGEEAIQIINQQHIHVVLLDMHMPRLTGIETAQRVRDSQLHIPCILLSAGLDDSVVEAARQVEIFASVSKPVGSRQIVQLVNQALRTCPGWESGSSDSTNQESVD